MTTKTKAQKLTDLLAYVFENTKTNAEGIELLAHATASYIVSSALEDELVEPENKPTIVMMAGMLALETLGQAMEKGIEYSETYTGFPVRQDV